MPKQLTPKLSIHLDLLKPQSNPEKIHLKFIRWLLHTGRFIFIFVEALVLIAFVARFKLDAELASKKEAIEQQIPYIESLKPFEILIRQAQLKLATIDSLGQNQADYPQILKKIADQTPAGVKIINFNMEKDTSDVTINLNATAQTNNDLENFLSGLKTDLLFSDVNVTSIGFEKDILVFSLSAQTKLGGKNL